MSLIGPLLTALALHSGAARWRPLALLLLAEPALIALGLYLWLVALSHRRWVCALGLLFGGATALGLLHLPPAPRESLSEVPPWSDAAEACLAGAEVPTSHVRILTWHAAGAPPSNDDVDRLAGTEPDLAVITGLPDRAALDQLAALRPGEVLVAGGPGDRLGLYVRGIFLDCRGAAAFWPVTIPETTEPALAHLAFALPRLQGGGVLPLVAFQVPAAGAGPDTAAWPASLADGVDALASLTHLSAGETIAVGYLTGVPGMAPVTATLEGAGLHDGGGTPTWPARLGPLPFLPQHRLGRVLAGAGWSTATTSSSLMDNAHRALLVELEPRREIAPLGDDGSEPP
jgi:hypothetical protein